MTSPALSSLRQLAEKSGFHNKHAAECLVVRGSSSAAMENYKSAICSRGEARDDLHSKLDAATVLQLLSICEAAQAVNKCGNTHELVGPLTLLSEALATLEGK